MKRWNSRWTGRLGAIILALLVVLAVSLAGGSQQRAIAQTPTPTPAGQQIVPLEVLKGPDNQTLAVVPIFINGQGPFAFALDTGATRSLVDRSIVIQLGLPVVGTEQVTGAMGSETAELVQLDRWQAGSVALPRTVAFTLDLPAASRAIGLAGFLGSDILSQYGSITIDFELEELILHMRP